MNRRILIVDDEVNLLRSFQRNLRKTFDVTIAEGGVAGLMQILEGGPFAAIVCDLQMPQLDGFQILAAARIAAPDTFRIMLSGNVSSQIVSLDENKSAWFQYLSKPCTTEQLCSMVKEGIDSFARLNSARVKVVTENSQSDPSMIGKVKVLQRCRRLRQWTRSLVNSMKLAETEKYEVAAMLSQLSSLVSSQPSDSDNSFAENELYLRRRQAELSSQLIRQIPRLGLIADMVKLQFTDEFESTVPSKVRIGARMLRMLTDFESLTDAGVDSTTEVIHQMKLRSNDYGELLFQSFLNVVTEKQSDKCNHDGGSLVFETSGVLN